MVQQASLSYDVIDYLMMALVYNDPLAYSKQICNRNFVQVGDLAIC